MRRTTRAMLAGAMALGLMLSGCGGGDGDDAAPKLTAQQQWAKSLCESLAPTTEAVDPPQTDGDDPGAAKKQVVTFLETLKDRLSTQQQALEEAGVPPDGDTAAYDKAKEQLATANETLDDVLNRFAKAKAEDAAALQAALVQVGESLANAASFRGPLAELSANDAKLKATLEDTEACSPMLES